MWAVVDIVEQAALMMELDVREHQPTFDVVQNEQVVSGLGNMDHVISECCKPVPGDSIRRRN